MSRVIFVKDKNSRHKNNLPQNLKYKFKPKYEPEVVIEKIPPVFPKSLNRFYMTRKKNEFPEFLNKLEDIWKYCGSNITLSLGYRGFPDPIVTWLKNNNIILDSSHIMIIAGERSTELIIFDAQKIDSGFYTCRIENDLSVCETHCQIHVDDKNTLRIQGKTSLAANFRPYQSILYNSVSLHCQTEPY